jgi:hypothetical protein
VGGLARRRSGSIMTDDLVREIQQLILGSSDDHERLRQLLAALQIPANAPRDPNAVRKVRRALLWSGASRSELRDALAGLQLTGVGPNDELLLRLNELLAAEGHGGGVPTA